MSTELAANIIGAIASSAACITWMPQARQTWRNRKDGEALSALSLGTQMLVALTSATWIAYGISAQTYWACVPNFVILPLALWTITMVSRARRSQTRLKEGPTVENAPLNQESPAGQVSA